ncbi:FecR family protein [Sphingomonas sp. PP-F2F-A104-K0414]|uniref:FecR family protein n=1 Tax=Sphingomonas sp. PP-F2F-A104-K0414 TaxID=2135661 RepID=UPI0010495FDC|nr:FecR domain-containing protein [Sphingomonas sp. PP-F2F-A104-K0414]TCP98597.1 FecR family protein [Sphingomonas sp. PP-F2F-A104-K0414]
MDATTQDPIDAAATWHARIDAPDMDWAGFGDWLDADPSHRAAYDSIALLDAEIAAAAPAIAALLPANDDGVSDHAPPARSTRWRWMATGTGGALAAGLALLLIGPTLSGSDASVQTYATDAGNTRAVTLADGSAMRLDRGSRVSVSGGTTPLIEIADGAASFSVRHDPSRTLIVRAGGYDIRDVGTRFAVVNAQGRISVAVAEGSVSVAPHVDDGSTSTTLTAGQRLDIDPATGIAARRTVAPTSVADWTDGRLDYDGAPLPLVVADISRYARTPLVVDPSAAGLVFSGVLTIGDGSRLLDQLRAVLPLRLHRADGVVHIERTGPR